MAHRSVVAHAVVAAIRVVAATQVVAAHAVAAHEADKLSANLENLHREALCGLLFSVTQIRQIT